MPTFDPFGPGGRRIPRQTVKKDAPGQAMVSPAPPRTAPDKPKGANNPPAQEPKKRVSARKRRQDKRNGKVTHIPPSLDSRF